MSPTRSSPMTEALRRWRIIPVIIIEDASNAIPLANALLTGGLPIAEITLRTKGALESLRRIKDAQPEMFAGAGTVLNVAQAKQAKDAGAEFVVSPGFNRSVVDYCLENDVPVYPGVATGSEIEAVLETGLNLMKLWPIETLGGVPYLQLLSGPFVGVEFNPSGGVTATNFTTYLHQKNVVAVGGNWMAPPEWIAGGQFDRIREIVRQTVTRVAAVSQIPVPKASAPISRDSFLTG
ncbi:MAG TPA: bifunctional 4-hydroxy-2-oxoglutarate aldolase/2-dehydro-3-deoxy-phosphogluconate aldolase [Gemmatimonadaceae bacterium]|nr:bifunctional 4-hydroxy-2-oxoglutarate aldolase/2-dehydro-3-deoxy-phosphogluconate aldolase [Gemmatimonadaceae bacterium]